MDAPIPLSPGDASPTAKPVRCNGQACRRLVPTERFSGRPAVLSLPSAITQLCNWEVEPGRKLKPARVGVQNAGVPERGMMKYCLQPGGVEEQGGVLLLPLLQPRHGI